MAGIEQQNVIEIVPPVRQTATNNATGVDIRDYDGPLHIIASYSAGGGTNPTLDIQMQESDALGSGYTDISGVAFAQVDENADATEMLTIQAGATKRYIRAEITISGTSPTFDGSVVAVGVLQAGRNSSQAV